MGEPVGLDIEDLSLKRNFLNLAKHFFSMEEYEYVRKFGVMAFYKLWTAKEAIAKLRGRGLAEVLRIKLCPRSVEDGFARLEGGLEVGLEGGEDLKGYTLERCVTADYIYTIAS